MFSLLSFFHSLYNCSICILIELRLNYGLISNKYRILGCGGYKREVLITRWRFFWSEYQWRGVY